jgi:hypothetical protein
VVGALSRPQDEIANAMSKDRIMSIRGLVMESPLCTTAVASLPTCPED